MTPAELKNQFRIEVADPEMPGSGDDSDSLWSTAEIFSFMHQAQREFARRTNCFTDILLGNVFATEPFMDLDASIVQVRNVYLTTAKRELSLVNLNDVAGMVADDYGTMAPSNWRTASGTPVKAISDMADGKLRLVPIPTADDEAEMLVYRYPLRTITATSVRFEVTDETHQRGLLHWMKKLAYEKQDVESMDLKRASEYELKWEQFIDASKGDIRKRRTKQRAVQYGGY